MRTFLLFVQVITSIMLITAVILHPAKGMGLGGIGSPAQLFGSQKGAEEGLNKITAIIVSVWALTAILLVSVFAK